MALLMFLLVVQICSRAREYQLAVAMFFAYHMAWLLDMMIFATLKENHLLPVIIAEIPESLVMIGMVITADVLILAVILINYLINDKRDKQTSHC